MLQLQQLGKLPLSFQENRGQAEPEVKFIARSDGYSLYLTPAETILLLTEKVSTETNTGEPALSFQDRMETQEDKVTLRKLRLNLAGANERMEISGEAELPGKANYFIGADPAGWHTDIPTYAKVKYKNVYPGVDMVYYGHQGRLEYDFVVAPGADPGRIALAIEGSELLQVNDRGDLVVTAGDGQIAFCKPFAYQTVNNRQQEVAADYALVDERVCFQLGEYDPGRELIIDPVLVYSTYLGGAGQDQGNGIAVDAAGNVYVTGFTTSTNTPGPGFPTMNPIQVDNNGSFDVFVTKINAAGNALVYSTYLGGTGLDQGNGVAVNAAGNAIVTGRTQSTNFPTLNAIQLNNNGLDDVFVTKINAAGNALVYSTYLGGSSADFGNAIAVDSAGNAYVTGSTGSSNTPGPGFPTLNPIQTDNNGAIDAFVTKINATGALVYSTYLGGSNFDFGFGIAVDTAGSAYVTGTTTSSNTPGPGFPTMNPIQSDNNGGNDAFVTKINAAGNALVYST